MTTIDAIKARCEAATPGPWYADGWATWDDLEGTFVELSEFTADAKFIAHAREDIPFLLERIADMEAQLSASQQETRAAVESLKRKCMDELAAVKCICDIETYLELGSAKYIKKTIDSWRGPQEAREGNMPRGHINEHLHTTLANSGRAAGAGISYDKYDDESGYRPGPRDTGRVKMPNDGVHPHGLNGPVIVVKPAKSANTTQII